MLQKLQLDRIEDNRAIFLTEQHQLVVFPSDFIMPGTKPGQYLYCELKETILDKTGDEIMAKAVLNELLNTDE